jgi:hypothetical protein
MEDEIGRARSDYGRSKKWVINFNLIGMGKYFLGDKGAYGAIILKSGLERYYVKHGLGSFRSGKGPTEDFFNTVTNEESVLQRRANQQRPTDVS